MAIVVDDVVQIQQIIRASGVNTVIGQAYQLEDAGTATTDTELLTSLIVDNWNPTFISGFWQAANDADVVAVCLKVQKILPTREDDFIFVQNIAGALVGDHLPVHAAAMVTKTDKTGGPGSSGRNFFPAPPAAHFTGGHLNAAGAALWNPLAAFLNDVLTLGAFATRWAPTHVRGSGAFSDIFRTWVNPNIRTIRTRQAVDCPV